MSTLASVRQQPTGFRDSTKNWTDLLTSTRTIWILLSVLAILVWGPRLFRTFWVDEAGTFWMARGGIIAAVQKTWHWPGQSVLYAAIASLFCLDVGLPMRDFVLRIPSVLGIAAAAYFLYKFVERVVGPGTGLVAVILLVFHPTIILVGSQARPYGLALGAVAASCWYLYSYVETGRKTHLMAYVVASALVVCLHYVFVAVFCAHAAYLLYTFWVNRQAVKWLELLTAYAAIGLLVMPLFVHMRLLLHEAHTLPLPIAPTVADLIADLLNLLPVFGLFLAAFLLQFIFPASLKRPVTPGRPFLVFVLAWWLLGPVLFFGLSTATPIRLFEPRYLSFSVLAQVLLLACAGCAVFESRVAQVWAMLAVLLTTASPLSIAASLKPGKDELGTIMKVIRAESTGGSLPPVFFSSPLPESNFYNWRGGAAKTYLYAPFNAYPVPNQLLPLPYRLTDEVKQHISDVVNTQLRSQPEVLFIMHQTLMDSWVPYMLETMKAAGFKAQVEQPNVYVVIIFRRPRGA